MPLTLSGNGSFSGEDITTFGGAWTTHTPVVTGVTTNPVLGNAVVNSKYILLGKIGIWRCRITWGSTSTFGVGIWGIVPPVSAAALPLNTCKMYDVSANTHVVGTMYDGGSGAWVISLDSSVNLVQPTVPFTWASGDYIDFTAIFEAA